MINYVNPSNEDAADLKNDQADDIKELPCQITRKLLVFLGALPIVLAPPYLPSLSITRSSFVYCVTIYIIFSYDVVKSVIIELAQFSEEDPSEPLRNLHLERIFASMPHFLGIHFWMDVPALLCTLEKYQDVQVKFRVATGKTLINRRKTGERHSVCLVATILCILFGFTYVSLPKKFQFDFVTGIAFVYAQILAICATYLWLGFSWGITDAAEVTKQEFRRQLDFMTPTRVYEFRRLWLSMRSTLDSMGSFSCTPAMYSCSLVATVILLYESAMLMQMGEVATAFGHLIFAAFNAGLVSLICTASHGVQEEMKCLVGELLPEISLSSYDMKVQREMVMLFLVESARPAVANLRGFIAVNKNLILSFFSNVSTYIIVLVQFTQKGGGFGVPL